MKIIKNLTLSLGISLAGLNFAVAQDEFDPLGEEAEAYLPKLIRVQVEFIEVPQKVMTKLLEGPKKSTNDTELRAEVQNMIEAKKAKMLDSQMVTARPGQKATSESIHEFIYPTEYEPPIFPPKPNEKVPEPMSFPYNPATPTAFETRNVGSTLEIEPNIGADDKIVELRMSPEIVYYTGNEVWSEVTKGKDKHKIQMPNFYTLRLQTGITVMTGEPFLVAALSPKNDAGEADFSRKVLVFVKADVLTTGR